MKATSQPVIHKIDAEGEILGRLATRVAFILQGKHAPHYQPNVLSGEIVEIAHIDRLKIDSRKAEGKMYYRHSGYPGGIRSFSLAELFKKDPEKVFRKTVFDMLPKNRLRHRMIKMLRFVSE